MYDEILRFLSPEPDPVKVIAASRVPLRFFDPHLSALTPMLPRCLNFSALSPQRSIRACSAFRGTRFRLARLAAVPAKAAMQNAVGADQDDADGPLS